jgi:hypothetical protein
MDKSNAVGKGCVGNKGVGRRRRGSGGKIEVPETSVGGAGTREQQCSVTMNVEPSGREGCRATVVAQLSNREERMGGKPRKNMCLAGGRGETRKGQGGNMTRSEDCAVRDTDC